MTSWSLTLHIRWVTSLLHITRLKPQRTIKSDDCHPDESELPKEVSTCLLSAYATGELFLSQR
jgi:hypothetical protein